MRKETSELLSPEQDLLRAEQTYGYAVVHAFDYAGHRFEIRKIVESKDAQQERVIFGVHAEDGTAHVRIDGRLSREQVFTMEYGINYKLDLRGMAPTPRSTRRGIRTSHSPCSSLVATCQSKISRRPSGQKPMATKITTFFPRRFWRLR